MQKITFAVILGDTIVHFYTFLSQFGRSCAILGPIFGHYRNYYRKPFQGYRRKTFLGALFFANFRWWSLLLLWVPKIIWAAKLIKIFTIFWCFDRKNSSVSRFFLRKYEGIGFQCGHLVVSSAFLGVFFSGFSKNLTKPRNRKWDSPKYVGLSIGVKFVRFLTILAHLWRRFAQFP